MIKFILLIIALNNPPYAVSVFDTEKDCLNHIELHKSKLKAVDTIIAVKCLEVTWVEHGNEI